MIYLRHLITFITGSVLLLVIFTVPNSHVPGSDFCSLVSKQAGDHRCLDSVHHVLSIFDRATTRGQNWTEVSRQSSVALKLHKFGDKILLFSRGLFKRSPDAQTKNQHVISVTVRNLWACGVHEHCRSSKLNDYSHFLSDIGKNFLFVRQLFNSTTIKSISPASLLSL